MSGNDVGDAHLSVQQQLRDIRQALAALQRDTVETTRAAQDAARDAQDAKEMVKKDQAAMQPIISTFDAGRLLGRIFFVLGGIASGIAAMYAAWSLWFKGHV